MAYCAKCGKALREGLKFCPSCGAPVSAGTPTRAPAPAMGGPAVGPGRKLSTIGIIGLIGGIMAASGVFLDWVEVSDYYLI